MSEPIKLIIDLPNGERLLMSGVVVFDDMDVVDIAPVWTERPATEDELREACREIAFEELVSTQPER